MEFVTRNNNEIDHNDVDNKLPRPISYPPPTPRTQVEFVSDASTNFRNFPTVNYSDPNLNVSIPVYSIHGNHDDPSGMGDLCSLDLLAAAGLVNYFGRQDTVDKVVVNPLLLRKNNTKVRGHSGNVVTPLSLSLSLSLYLSFYLSLSLSFSLYLSLSLSLSFLSLSLTLSLSLYLYLSLSISLFLSLSLSLSLFFYSLSLSLSLFISLYLYLSPTSLIH